MTPVLCLVAAAAILSAAGAAAADWPQWCGSDGKNMVSAEKGLPETFVPGRKRADRTIDLSTARGVKWGVKLGDALYSTPAVAEGKVFIGGVESQDGILVVWTRPAAGCGGSGGPRRERIPTTINGSRSASPPFRPQMGVCSSPAVERGRVYFVSQPLRGAVPGRRRPAAGTAGRASGQR